MRPFRPSWKPFRQLAFENDGDTSHRATYSSGTSSFPAAIAYTRDTPPLSSTDYCSSSTSSLTTGSGTAPPSPGGLRDSPGSDHSFDEQPPTPAWWQFAATRQGNLAIGRVARFAPDDNDVGGGADGGGHRRNSSVPILRLPSSLLPSTSPTSSKTVPAQKRSTMFGSVAGVNKSTGVRLQGHQEHNTISTAAQGPAGWGEPPRSARGDTRSFINPCPTIEVHSCRDPLQFLQDEPCARTQRVSTSCTPPMQPCNSMPPFDSTTGSFIRIVGGEHVEAPFSHTYKELSAGSSLDTSAAGPSAGQAFIRTGQQQEMEQLSTLDDLLMAPDDVATVPPSTSKGKPDGFDWILAALGSVGRGGMRNPGMRSQNMRSQNVDHNSGGWTGSSHQELRNSADMWSNGDQALVGTPSAVPGAPAWLQELVTTGGSGACFSSARGGGGGADRRPTRAGFTCP